MKHNDKILQTTWIRSYKAGNYALRTNKLILIISLFFLNCCNVPAKQKTTLDNIKLELKKELHQERYQRIMKIPYSINNLLIPKIYNQELNHSDDFNQLYRKFNITADNVSAREFFLSLVNDTPINIVVHPEVQGSVSLSLKNVTINEVLEEVQKIYGFGFESSEQSMRIFPVSLQTRVFKVNYLDLIRSGSSGTHVNFSGISGGNSSGGNSGGGNSGGGNSGGSGGSSGSGGSNSGSSGEGNQGASAANGSNVSTSHSTNVWQQLKITIEAMLGIAHNKANKSDENTPSKNVAVSPTTGMIIVTAYPNELDNIEKFLNNAESTLNKQVMLEAKVLEVDLKDGYRSGINWALLNQNMNIAQIANNGTRDFNMSPGSSSSESASNAQENIDLIAAGNARMAPTIPTALKSFGGLFTLGMNYRKLATFVELLSAQGNVQVLSSPRITTSNNQKALIKVGKDEYYITGVSNNQTTSTTGSTTATTSAPTVTLSPFFSGIALDVTPQIGEDDITLHIHPIISDVGGNPVTLPGYDKDVKLAASSIRESDSIIRAKNGQLIIIGGLMKDKTAEVISGIPFFKDIPFLGTLFRHTTQQSAKSELVILLRPIILDDYKIKHQIKSSYKKINDLDRGFHFGGGNTWYGNLGESKE